MTEFKLGDKVRVISVTQGALLGFSVGDNCEIFDVDSGGTYRYGIKKGRLAGFADAENLTLRGRNKSSNARLTEAEAEIATLKAQVAALEKADKPNSPYMSYETEDFGKAIECIAKAARRSVQTPNQRRADVIKRAQAFVADLERRAFDGDGSDGNSVFEHYASHLTFHVNPGKRVITAMAHGSSGKVFDKAFAKCHPNDVFNADIGKAIAAGKLYGVDIPQEFTDAPKPAEVVVGMRVENLGDAGGIYEIKSVDFEELRINEYGEYFEKRYAKILDDTDAEYS